MDNSRQYMEIRLKKKGPGFGFNIVGGCDKEHVPGNSGFFVSRIRVEGVASLDGRLQIGDRIVSVDGTVLNGKTHAEAVDMFKNAETITLEVEKDGEKLALNMPSALKVSSLSTPSHYSNSTTSTGTNGGLNSDAPPSYASAVTAGTNADATPVPSYASVAAGAAAVPPNHNRVEKASPTAEGTSDGARILVPEKKKVDTLPNGGYAPATTDNNDDGDSASGGDGGGGSRPGTSQPAKKTATTTAVESDASADVAAPSSNSVEEVQRTSKFPTFFLDPAQNSSLSELLFLTMGTVALGAAVFLGYRFYKNR